MHAEGVGVRMVAVVGQVTEEHQGNPEEERNRGIYGR